MDFNDISKKINHKNQNGILCIIVKVDGTVPRQVGSKMIVWADGTTDGTIGGGEFEREVIQTAKDLFQSKSHTELFEYNQFDENCNSTKKIDIYLEKIITKATIMIYGAGFVGAAIAELAVWNGFNIFLGDDRLEIIKNLSETITPMAHCISPKEFVSKVKSQSEKIVICATRSIDIDLQFLPDLLDEEIKYIGILGSTKRWKKTRERLIENQVAIQALKNVQSPIGLSIKAHTPKEIAVSVIAQLIQEIN